MSIGRLRRSGWNIYNELILDHSLKTVTSVPKFLPALLTVSEMSFGISDEEKYIHDVIYVHVLLHQVLLA